MAYKGLVSAYHIRFMDFGEVRTLYHRLIKELQNEAKINAGPR